MDLKTITDRVGKQRKKANNVFFSSDVAPQLAETLTEIINQDAAYETKCMSIAQAVVGYLLRNGRFFKDKSGQCKNAVYLDETYKYYYPISSDSFRGYLAQVTGINRAGKVFEYVKSAVEDVSVGRNIPVIRPSSYWYVSPQATYITYKPGTVVRIDRNGFRIVNNGTDNVVFPVNNYTHPWELQETFADPFKTLIGLSKATYENDWSAILLKMWVLAMFCLETDSPKPILMISGDGRSGKTIIANTIMKMLGLPDKPDATTARGKDEETFWLRVDKGGVLAIDNVDEKIDWLPNALCCAASSDSYTRRALYTDKGEVSYASNAWIIATSAKPAFADNTSLTDRMVVVKLRNRDGYVRSFHPSVLEAQAIKYQSHIMSWVVNEVQRYYTTPHVRCDISKRDPKFSSMAATFGRIWKQEESVIRALTEGEQTKMHFALSNSKVGAMLILLARKSWSIQPFEGDAHSLLCLFKEVDCSFNLMSLKEFVDEMRSLGPSIANHLFYSAGGEKSNPWYRIGGVKDSPGSFDDSIVPCMDEMTVKTTKEKAPNPYLI